MKSPGHPSLSLKAGWPGSQTRSAPPRCGCSSVRLGASCTNNRQRPSLCPTLRGQRIPLGSGPYEWALSGASLKQGYDQKIFISQLGTRDQQIREYVHFKNQNLQLVVWAATDVLIPRNQMLFPKEESEAQRDESSDLRPPGHHLGAQRFKPIFSDFKGPASLFIPVIITSLSYELSYELSYPP